MSNTKTSRNIYFAFLTVFLTAALFTGCGKNESDHHASEKASENDAASGEMTVILPGNVTLPMVKIEAGMFEMSAKDGENTDDEVPHRAMLTRDFYLGKTEVTLAQWKAVMETNPSEYKDDDLPVEYVSWNDAMEFCGKLNNMGKAPNGWKFTLPTETQWEYAARGGNRSKGYKYSGSDNVDDVAWYEDNAGWAVRGDVMSPVGRKKPNELGLYDMSGNVYEWCLDDWQDKSDMLTPEFTRGNDSGGSERAIRGGSWNNPARTCRSAERNGGEPDDRNGDFGFRLALVPESY